MIHSISINNVASFDASGVLITDLKKINFMYGANGSGKTTISNLIANLDNEDYQECTVNWQHGIPLKTLVYNKQFRENNFGQGKGEYIQLFQNILNELSQIEATEKAKKETLLNIDTFAAHAKTAESQFVSNKELLSNKIKEPSRSIELVLSENQLKSISEIILEANNKIKEHNKIVTNYQAERNDLIQSIWKYLAEKFKEDIKKYKKKISGLQKGIDCLAEDIDKKRKQWAGLNEDIKKLTQNVTSIQPTIDQINTTLKAYGFVNFEIVPSDEHKNHYQIKREDGTSAGSMTGHTV